MEKKHNYLFLLVAAVLVVAVFAGVMINNSSANTGMSGSFALMSSCKELNNMFMNNNCYGPGDFDGYTCMKIMEAKEQLNC